MARNTAWLIAVLLLLPAPGRAAGLADAGICATDLCEKPQAPQQRGAHPQSGAKPDKTADKPEERRPVKWWIDAKARAELAITDQQSALVEQIWQKSAPALREGREKLNKLEEVLSALTNGNDEAAVVAQSTQVEKLRAELNTGRTLMIYKMDRILTPEQRAKVKAMYHPDQGKRGPTGPR